MENRNQGNYRNPCLTMHQPWASLLVYGIKRMEGKSWPAPIRGRLWIHTASKVPDESTIKAMKSCIEVVGCVQADELAGWNVLPKGVRLEAQTDYCWLCEQPLALLKLLIPFEMRGYRKIYSLEKKIYEAAARVLTIVGSPPTVNFPLPNPRDLFSLKPGSLLLHVSESEQSEPGKSSSLNAAIAGARAAATQFSKNQNWSTSFSTRTSAMTIEIEQSS
ncbi:hypothetical protein EUGRSUZ_H04289 [Eucalyptus grandis]|uniref:Uncharacterized protein n=2 Tax=Eucalyptus grandis TaxID=71139 RepID=A0ACC3JX86_EUCGR|nr:hypothetical protein EUGRSUZ_H04289 [Eucalyptus grandis]